MKLRKVSGRSRGADRKYSCGRKEELRKKWWKKQNPDQNKFDRGFV
jgi:hypothetical protein